MNTKMEDLARVAEMMDFWTRTENEAYSSICKQLRQRIRMLEGQLQSQIRLNNEYLTRLNTFAAVIHESQAFGVEHLHTFRVLTDRDGAPAVFEQIDLTAHEDEELTETEPEYEPETDLISELMGDV